jgi:hypothetical protein
MMRYNAPFEIHLHGEVPLRPDVSYEQLQEALKPVWTYAGARSLAAAAASAYEEEPGIRLDTQAHLLQMCWTVGGDEDFRQILEEMCMALNDLAVAGAALEVTFYDTRYDDEDDEAESEPGEARDDFVMYFVGPTPAAIMQVQRDLLVQDAMGLLERHFESSELGGVIAAIDQLFEKRFNELVNSMQLGRPPRGLGGSGSGGHGGGRKPRHLH